MARGRKKKELPEVLMTEVVDVIEVLEPIEEKILIKNIELIENKLIREYLKDIITIENKTDVIKKVQEVLRITISGWLDERTIANLNSRKGLLPRIKEKIM